MSAIGTDDVVYEIGPGRGVLTQTLADRAARVVAIERDPLLARMLRRRFRTYKNVEIATCDILRYRIREQRPFKIISNVPYGITARLMQKILYEQPIATEIYLILQREAAEKYSGLGGRGETLQSVLAKVHFEFEILFLVPCALRLHLRHFLKQMHIQFMSTRNSPVIFQSLRSCRFWVI